MKAAGILAGTALALLLLLPRGFETPGFPGVQLHQTGFLLAGVASALLWACHRRRRHESWKIDLLLFAILGSAVVSAAVSGVALAKPRWLLYPIVMLFVPYVLARSAMRGGGSGALLRLVQLVAVALALMAIGEHIAQEKLFGARTFYDEQESLYTLNLSRKWNAAGVTDVPLSSIGPFANNLPLAGVFTALGGLLIGLRRSVWGVGVASLLVGCAVHAIQSRAGLISLLFFLGAYAASDRVRVRSLAATIGVALSFAITIGRIGYIRWIVVFANDIYAPEVAGAVIVLPVVLGFVAWAAARTSTLRVFTTFFAGVSALVVAASFVSGGGDGDAGGLGGRLYGNSVLVRNLWLHPLGTGPGSLFQHDEALGVEIFSDQGSLQTFCGELGIVSGICLVIVIVRSISLAARSGSRITIAAGLGIAAATPGVLSSVPPEPWIVIVAFACIVEATSASGTVVQHAPARTAALRTSDLWKLRANSSGTSV